MIAFALAYVLSQSRKTWERKVIKLINFGLFLSCLLCLQGCAIKQVAISKLGDTLAEGGSVYASDDDIELVGEALPFSLKTVEGLLAEVPEHKGLLLTAASGFTQYSYVYVDLDALELESSNPRRAAEQHAAPAHGRLQQVGRDLDRHRSRDLAHAALDHRRAARVEDHLHRHTVDPAIQKFAEAVLRHHAGQQETHQNRVVPHELEFFG